MKATSLLRERLRLSARFAQVPPVALGVFDYAVEALRAEVACLATRLSRRLLRVYIMNELCSGFVSRGVAGRRLTAPLSGWQRLPLRFPTLAFYDPTHARLFAIEKLVAPAGILVRLFRARE